MNTGKRAWRRYPAWGLAILWFVAMLTAFWWFQLRSLRAFDASELTRTEFFTGTELARHLPPLMQTHAKARVVHFWDPACACNRFNQVHVNNLMEEYGNRLVEFLVVVRARPGHDPQRLQAEAHKAFPHAAVVEVRTAWPQQGMPPSSPAVAVTDARGKLAYFGPYSIGAVCSVGNGDFVEGTLNKLLQGNNPQQVNTLATGCFCPWQRSGNV
ncbi:DUF6436 domain-containing protein [Sulfuriflexus mobilis]|uniref:DUF6436 domain-containing protein n=1 Tax=Sulfuriflexus mobilis TaxID=1811807 RepID=UPI000F83EDC4|nr:DUF6436 domain-containing protein [Sulfuriflexus mobilis]